MMKTLKQHPLVLFFILAFLFPWLVWGTTIAQSRGILQFHIPQSLAFSGSVTIESFILSSVMTVLCFASTFYC